MDLRIVKIGAAFCVFAVAPLAAQTAADSAPKTANVDGLSVAEKRKAVQELKKALHSDAASAENAAQALAALGGYAEGAIPDLISALRFDEESVYKSVREALLSIGTPSIPALQRVLFDSNLFVRRRSAEILGAFGEKAKAAAPDLIRLLRDPTYDVRAAAQQALIAMGGAAVPAVAAAYRREDEVGRKDLLVVLAKLGPEATKVILPALRRDPSPHLRSAAAEALTHIQPPQVEGVPVLVECLADMDEGVRAAAADALGDFGASGKSAIGALIESSKLDKEPLVRDKARAALQKIGAPNKDSLPGLLRGMRAVDPEIRLEITSLLSGSEMTFEEAAPVIVAAVKDSVPQVRLKGVEAAGVLSKHSEASFPVYRTALTDPQPMVRSAAIRELGRFTTAAAPASELLREPLKDPNPALRLEAINALGALGPAAVPILLEASRDEYAPVAQAAESAILAMGPDAAPALQSAASGTNPVLAQKAAGLLKRLPSRRKSTVVPKKKPKR